MGPENERWTLPDWPATLRWCQDRNAQGIRCALDILGEYAKDRSQAEASHRAYEDCIGQISDSGLNASISIKLSSLGAMFDEVVSETNARKIGELAMSKGIGFEIDMEGRQQTDLTLKVARDCANSGIKTTVTLQSYLRRTLYDLDDLQLKDLRIRLVKGAYIGDQSEFGRVREMFMLMVQALRYLDSDLCISTHDPYILSWTKYQSLDCKKVEFAFLKGLADETKLKFVEQGFTVSEYVPFGKESGPYIARRLKYLRDLETLDKKPAP